MGVFASCCGKSESYVETPDRETMRQLQAQAIDKRLKENEKRGIKNVDNVKAQQARKQEYEARQAEADRNRGASNEGQLRWQMS